MHIQEEMSEDRAKVETLLVLEWHDSHFYHDLHEHGAVSNIEHKPNVETRRAAG